MFVSNTPFTLDKNSETPTCLVTSIFFFADFGMIKEDKFQFLMGLPKFENLHTLITCGVEMVSHGIC